MDVREKKSNEKRLIDADAFAGCLERMTKTAYPNLFPGLLEAIDFVKDFPTVDAVEVVRCKDCKHWHAETGWCYHHSHFIGSNGEACHPWESCDWKMLDAKDFCSYGERKDND